MRTLFVVVLAAAAVTAGAFTMAQADHPRKPLVVIVARSSKVTNISRSDLRRTFTGTSVTVAGTRIVPFNYMPSSPERVTFDRVVLGLSPNQAGRFWIDRKVRGQSAAPRTLPSAAHVSKVVAKFPGAIGYLPADQVTGDVKILAIDGLLPSDAGYPLMGE